MLTDAEHAIVLRDRIRTLDGLLLRDDEHIAPIRKWLRAERTALLRAIELLEAPELPMEIIEVPDWRADADRLADALDQLMAAFGRDWGPAVDALIAHQELTEAWP